MSQWGGYAVVLQDRTDIGGVLMIVDDRKDATEIALQLRQRGHEVDVRELAPGPRSNGATNGATAPPRAQLSPSA